MSLAQSFLAEALRNVAKHAEATRIDVELERDADTLASRFATTVCAARPARAGMGLRLAAFEALQQGGIVEFGEGGDGGWRARLVVPLSHVGAS